MSAIDDARSALVVAANVLVERRGNTTDSQEKAAIDQAIGAINAKLGILNQVGLLQAAKAVADATDELKKVVASAKTRPFDNFVTEIQGSITRLVNAQGQLRQAQ